MARILVAFSTVDGHTRKICERLQWCLESEGHTVTLSALGEALPADVESFDKVVVGASIRYGRHRQAVYEFIRANQRALEARPSAFFSVNVVARKPGKDTPQSNPYMQGFRRKSPWQPALLAVFAGKIDYRRYGLLDRLVIRFIMWLTRGPTGANDCVEFTDWAGVEDFGRRVSAL